MINYDDLLLELIRITNKIKEYPSIEIDQPIYKIGENWQRTRWFISRGYVSSLRQDKDRKWSFRFSYWNQEFDTETAEEPPLINKNEKGKSVQNVDLTDLYIEGEYIDQHYFTDYYEAKKIVEKLNKEKEIK